jgi:predicted ATPase
MKIENIRLRNFKVFRELEINDLPRLVFFVGANGTGKSTLFDVFGFLKDALDNNVHTALQKRGGYKEVVTRDRRDEAIEIEIQFRMEITGTERLVTYRLEIIEQAGRAVVQREVLRYKRGRYGSPYHFLDFVHGQGYAVTNEEDFSKTDEELEREGQVLDNASVLAIKGIGQFQRFKAANAFRSLIENWHVSDFHIMAARQRVEAGVAEHLSVTGDNLPLVTQYIYENRPDIFEQIRARMRERVPGVELVEAEETIDGHVVLRFQDGSFKDPFISRFVSDGTIKMFAYLVLLYDPAPHPLLCIEEPENQLYPNLLVELSEELRNYGNAGGQVMVSTHSPDLINAAELEEVFLLSKRDGCTIVERVQDNAQIRALVDAGDQIGYLWRQGFFGEFGARN